MNGVSKRLKIKILKVNLTLEEFVFINKNVTINQKHRI